MIRYMNISIHQNLMHYQTCVIMITISKCDVIQHYYNTGDTDCVTRFRNGVCLKEIQDFYIAFDLLECMTQMICKKKYLNVVIICTEKSYI